MSKIRALFCTTIVSSLIGTAAMAQTITWNVGYINASGSSYVETLKTVPERISKATNGRLKIELYDTLVAGPDQPAAVRDGSLDATFAVGPWLSAEAPLLNVGMLPGLLTDVPMYHKLLDPYIRDVVAKVWHDKYNAHQLATGVFELQSVISKEPLLTLEGFNGKKIRVHNNSAADLMVQIGGAPTAVPFGEIVPALQRGIVDVVMTSVGTANGIGFSSVAKHVSIWNIGAVLTWSFVVNEDVWNKLPGDLKPLVEQEFRKIEDDHFAENEAFNAKNIEMLRQSGMEVTFIPQAEIERLFSPENIKPVYESWYSLNDKSGLDGRAMVKKIQELKEKL